MAGVPGGLSVLCVHRIHPGRTPTHDGGLFGEERIVDSLRGTPQEIPPASREEARNHHDKQEDRSGRFSTGGSSRSRHRFRFDPGADGGANHESALRGIESLECLGGHLHILRPGRSDARGVIQHLEKEGYLGERGRIELLAIGLGIKIDSPEVDIPRVGIIDHVSCPDVIGIARLAGRSDVHDVPAFRIQFPVLVGELPDRTEGQLFEEEGMMGVSDEGDEVISGREPFFGIGDFLHVPEAARFRDFGMDEEEIFEIHLQGNVAEKLERFRGEILPGPENHGMSVLVEDRRIDQAGGGRVVIAENKMIRHRTNPVEDLLGPRTVSDDIAQADQHIGLQAADIREDLLPGGQVSMDIGKDREPHG